MRLVIHRCLGVRAAPFALAAVAIGLTFATSAALAQDVAKVNGRAITEADVKLAEAEIGAELQQVPPQTRRRLLIEYVIENQVFAEAAEGAKLDKGPAYDQQMAFWKRRALRDLYFEQSVKASVKEADAKAFYDEQIKSFKGDEEVLARHILVDDEAKAKDIAAKLKAGGDFAALAKEHSKDPGSKEKGGELGYFGKGMMVPEFEKAAFALEKGKLSDPVKSQFGFHVIRVDDKRAKRPPPFDAVKDRIINSMIGQKAQTVAADLRAKSKVEYLDPVIAKEIEDEKKAAAAKPPEPQKK
jgi:peptidyl-prolyl cis-trans isomerase C